MSDDAAATAVSFMSVVVVVAVDVDSGIVTHRPRRMRIKTLGMLVMVNGESSSAKKEEEVD
jgi:hypothetical protein